MKPMPDISRLAEIPGLIHGPDAMAVVMHLMGSDLDMIFSYSTGDESPEEIERCISQCGEGYREIVGSFGRPEGI